MLRLQLGNWRFDIETFVIYHVSRRDYELDLDDCTDPAKVLDWLTAFASKVYFSDEDIGQLFRFLNELLDFFSNYCPGGVSRTASPRSIIAKRLSDDKDALP